MQKPVAQKSMIIKEQHKTLKNKDLIILKLKHLFLLTIKKHDIDFDSIIKQFLIFKKYLLYALTIFLSHCLNKNKLFFYIMKKTIMKKQLHIWEITIYYLDFINEFAFDLQNISKQNHFLIKLYIMML